MTPAVDPPRTPTAPDPSGVPALARLLVDPSAESLERALAAHAVGPPENPAASLLRGELARRRGDFATASRLLGDALSALPDVLPAYHSAAMAEVAQGHRDAARALWRELVLRAPDDRFARYQIALTFHEEGDLAQALYWYDQQVARHPDTVQAWHNLGSCAQDRGDLARAVTAFRRAVALDPRRYTSWMALGGALRASGDNRGAIDAWRQAHALQPSDPRPLRLAAGAWGAEAELLPAIEMLDGAIALAPDDPTLRWHAGSHLSNLGLHDQALSRFREAAELAPQDGQLGSLVLLEMQYELHFASRERLAREHWAWGERYAAHLPRVDGVHSRARRPEAADRLRIGYVSPRFSIGPLANLFLPVLRAHDRRRFHITLYSAHDHDDDVARAMRNACDAWRTLPADDDEAARLIAADRLDLLIDLAGHAPGNRLTVLARKPSPVAASWLDYFETTGVEAIDYLISDAVHTPESDASHFRERLALLPVCRFVYAPVVPPPRSPAPVRQNGFVTFGSFNRHAKITAGTLALWKDVLGAVPGSRLRLRANAYRGAGTVAWVRERWAALGMPVERIDLLPYLPLAQAIHDYANVDIALDTFPYNGGITTCDALAMGVPVIALVGDRMIARQSAALLGAAQRPAWIAAGLPQYVDIAQDLAHPGRLQQERDRLWREFPRTPLCDVPGFVAAFERACRRLVELGPCDRAGGTPGPLRLD